MAMATATGIATIMVMAAGIKSKEPTINNPAARKPQLADLRDRLAHLRKSA